MSKTYRVLGMTCGGCASSVTKAIEAAAAGARVQVDLEAKTVTVDGATEDGAIQTAVEDAGFDYGGPV